MRLKKQLQLIVGLTWEGYFHKKISMRYLFLLCCLTGWLVSSDAQTLTVGTYNLRYDNKGDSGNLWVNRAPVVASLIRFHDFDVFGTQEGLKNQLDDLQNALPEYAWYGIGRDDGKDKGEHSAVFYKRDKFVLLAKGDFWLSTTPDKPGPGWDARLNRICSWVRLQDKATKKKFYFFSVHYDHQGVQARIESSKLIQQKIKEIAGNEPALFAGDLNGGRDSEWYKTLAGTDWLIDSYQQAKITYANNGSFNAFGKQLASNEVIDHVFTTKRFKVDRWAILTDSYHGKFPSDHFPVLVKLSLPK